jgi:hypothetical protein
MAQPRNEQQLGERISGVEATLEAFEKYERDRWHKLAQDMQPLVHLPTQIARDIAKIQGSFEGRISSVTREIERSITAAVEKAIEPVNADVASLKTKVEALEASRLHESGAKHFAGRLLQSPVISGFIGALMAGLAFAWAVVTGKVP